MNLHYPEVDRVYLGKLESAHTLNQIEPVHVVPASTLISYRVGLAFSPETEPSFKSTLSSLGIIDMATKDRGIVAVRTPSYVIVTPLTES